ncbi:MAG TPA: bifunctional UDP-sugar hydrolase/5'-nucleotidase [Gemmatimonadaceae bacterium]|nr:bifunctional UDP-sugar hydrolase/5'-nucleotidase [Gemmatimonadaceae bacterium]
MVSVRSRSAVLILALIAGCAPATRPAAGPPSVSFLLVNDVYVPDTSRDGTGGLHRLATVNRTLDRQGNAIFVLAGDVLSPSLLSKWYGGRQMVDAFNAAGLEYATFGNHEFELPRDTLVARIAASQFKWLSANCILADGAPFPRVAPWDTVTTGGVRVGLFAVTLEGEYRSYVRCTDPDSAAHLAIQALRTAGAELIVGLTHQDVTADSALLAREPDVALVLGGHEHDAHDVSVGGRRVLKADANARTAQFVTLSRAGDRWMAEPRLMRIDRSVEPDAATAQVVDAWRDSLVRRLGPERVVGTAPSPLEGRDEACRSRECSLGDLVADALRLGTGADVALINSGNMRIDDDIGPGTITNYHLESIFLFADESRNITFQLTGARLRELLEHGVSERSVGRGAFLQMSGVELRYDPTRPSGSRIVGDLRRTDGAVLSPADSLRVTFGVFPACQGGDGYLVPEAAEACKTAANAPRAVDLLMQHVTERLNGRIVSPRGGRITEVRQ